MANVDVDAAITLNQMRHFHTSSNIIPSNPIQDCFMGVGRAKSTPDSPQNIIEAVADCDKQRSQPALCYQCSAKRIVIAMLIMPRSCRIFEALLVRLFLLLASKA